MSAQLNTRRSRHRAATLITAISSIVALAAGLVVATTAHAYGPKGHLVSANQALDELQAQRSSNVLLRFDNGTGVPITLPVTRTEAVDAVIANPDAYRAGALGPDAFPDLITGQMFAHGNAQEDLAKSMRKVATAAGLTVPPVTAGVPLFSGLDYDQPLDERHGISEYRAIDFPMAMLRYWANSFVGTAAERSQALAFIVGYFGHGVGDGFAHTWVNEKAGGAWSLSSGTGDVFGTFTEEVRHMALENFLDARIGNGPLSSDGSGNNAARIGMQIPVRFLDEFYSSETANRWPVGSKTSARPADHIDYYRVVDRFHGGPTYTYFNAQVNLVDALGRWTRLKPFFEQQVNRNAIRTVEGLATLMSFPDKLANDILTLTNPLHTYVQQGFNQCSIHPWTSNGNLGSTLQDISVILGFPDRLQRQTRRAEAARKNWLLLNACTATNVARIKVRPAATPTTDACADIVRIGWGPNGLQDGGLLSSGTTRADIEWRDKTVAAFLGGTPGRTLEQSGEFLRVGPNIERIYRYLIGPAFTAPTILDAVFPEGLNQDWANGLNGFCGAITGADGDDNACLIGAMADALSKNKRLIDCERDHAQCIYDSNEKCLQDNCNTACPGFFDCSGFCGEPTKCTAKCNDMFRWCRKILGVKVCVPIGPLGPFDPSALLSCKGTCQAFGRGVADCVKGSFDTAPCGIKSVTCSSTVIINKITGEAGTSFIQPLINVCNAMTDFVDAVACLKDGDPNADPETLWDGRFDCAMRICTTNLTTPLQGTALSLSDAQAKCAAEVMAIEGVLDSARSSTKSVSSIYDLLNQDPNRYVNIAFLDEDIQAEPLTYGLPLALRLVTALGTVLPTMPLAQQCDIDEQLRPICSGVAGAFCPPRPTGCPAVTVQNSWLFNTIAPGVPPAAAEVEHETQKALTTLRFLVDNGIVQTTPGPTATRLGLELGATVSSTTFDTLFNTIQGMKLAAMVDRASTDSLLLQAGTRISTVYSGICREANFASPLCDVIASFDDPDCVGTNADREQCPAGLRQDLGNGLQWSVGRGIHAFNDPGTPNELTRFAPAATVAANRNLYDRIFRGPQAGIAATTFRAAVTRTGYYPVQGPTSAARRLSFTPLEIGRSAPVASLDGDIFFGTSLGDLYSVRVNDAFTSITENWHRDINTAEQPSAGQLSREWNGVTFEDFIYVGGETFPLIANALLKLRASTGEPVWQHTPLALGEIRGAPLVDLDRDQVYFATGANTVHGVRASTGQGLWEVRITQSIFGLLNGTDGALAQGPDGTLYAATSEGFLVAINPTIGIAASARVRWAQPLGAASVATPAIGSVNPNLIYVGTRAKELVAVRSTGGVQWRAPTSVSFWQNGNIDAAAAVAPDGTVYFGGEDQVLHAINGTTGGQLWTFPVNGAIRGGPVVDRSGTIYVATAAGRLYALRPGAGISNQNRPYFTTDLGFGVLDSLAMDKDGNLLVTARGVPSLHVVLR